MLSLETPPLPVAALHPVPGFGENLVDCHGGNIWNPANYEDGKEILRLYQEIDDRNGEGSGQERDEDESDSESERGATTPRVLIMRMGVTTTMTGVITMMMMVITMRTMEGTAGIETWYGPDTRLGDGSLAWG
ncbi:hypothetical protein EJ06DRAFT_553616 [Trichodelitschia bisporula]|uniref:Uncharacterized protein n=1 Tax=Trichodelitschia bisporula TaxID=703511 RepID=A0A6G1I921_9PEZI|nr:hypothetical protein EJ06DRAFT_553616 [Trichodelitschia bisporula]